jgi:hypothetical protein
MTTRDEPLILADLIRLHTRLERFAETLGEGTELHTQTLADMELIEQARAALHKYVVAAGKGQIAKKRGSFFRRK